MQQQYTIANAKTVEDFEALEANLAEEDPTFAQYLQSNWLCHKEKLVAAWIHKYEHFGHRVSSCVKGAYSGLKQQVCSCTGNLTKLLGVRDQIMAEIRSEYVSEVVRQANIVDSYIGNNPLFKIIVRKVMLYQLRKVHIPHYH